MNDSAFKLYGKGVFTTVVFQGGKPFLWEKHWARLRRDSAAIGMDVSGLNEAEIRVAVLESIAASSLASGRTRITLADLSAGPVWNSSQSEKSVGVSILVGPRRDARELKATISPFPVNSRSPLAGLKTCNYLDNMLALEDARARGLDEAVRVNENGILTGSCIANLFWVENDLLRTPDLSTGALPGTTREFILENLSCEEVEAGVESLGNAKAIYLSSAGLGVARVAEFDGRTMPDIDHPILHLLPWTR